MKKKTFKKPPIIEAMEPRLLFSDGLEGVLAQELSVEMTTAVSTATLEQLLTESPETSESRAAEETRQEIIFVDTDTPDYQVLVDDLLANQDATRHFEVVLLNNDRDGITQVTEALGMFEGIDAVHIISHGDDGRIELGASTLDFEALKANVDQIQNWGDALTADGDLLIYGCNLAASANGEALVDGLAKVTGADVAASDDLTGSAEQGGDWELEYKTGLVEAEIMISAEMQQSWQGVLVDVSLQSHDPGFASLVDTGYEVKSGQSYGQTFDFDSTNTDYEVNKLDLVLSKTADADPGQTISISLRDGWNGTVLGSANISSDSLTTSEAWYSFDIGSVTLNDNTSYYIQVDSDGGGKVYLGVDDASTYANGDLINASGGAEPGKDAAFRVIRSNLSSVSDNFDDGAGGSSGYTGDDGTENWVGGWTESGDTNNLINVVDKNGGGDWRLSLQGDGTVTDHSVSREVDLTGSSFAMLTYDFEQIKISAYDAAFAVEIRDGDTGWTQVAYYDTWNSGIQNESISIASNLRDNGNTEIRLRSAVLSDPEELFIDNIQIAHDGTGSNEAPVLDASEANLWLSTIDDMTGSAAPGLASWTDGEILDFGATDLSLGENTTGGTFSSTGFNLDAFAGDADIDALHYVTQTVTVGSGANAIDLLAGDLLLSTDTGETLTSSNTLAVGHEDVFVFRPDTPGDYTSGTFIFLLDNPFGGGLKGVTLVEQDTTVGDVTLEAGSFVLSKGDKNLYHYTADTVGLTTTTGSLTTLIEGADIGIDQNIVGVALVQTPTTTGGVTLNAGQLLVTLDNEDNDVDGLNTERRDIIALTITQTGINTLGSATLLFDADDVGLVDKKENLDALTLVTQAGFDPIVEDISDGANTGTLVSDLINNLITDVDADPEGIAVTGVDDANGTWQYSTDGGSSWLAFGGVTDNSALLLTATANDLIRFVPDADWNGSATIDFRAWDSSDGGTSGDTGVDASTNGGDSAFSSATATGLITVRAVNDDPLNTVPGAQSIDEDTALVFSSGNGNLVAVSDDAIDGELEVTLTVSNGMLTLAQTTGLTFSAGGDGQASMTFFATVADANAALDGLSYLPDADYSGAATLTISTDDQGHVGTGGALSDSDVVNITVNAINDAPELDASEANLWLSTIDDMTGSAAPGLSNWTDGEMLEFGAPDLSFGENTTDGTFSSTGFNLDAFAGDADIDALHYVTQTVTVGSGANAIDLLAGDLLLSTDTGETLTSSNTLAVGHEDVFVFRPDTPGDYTAGTFIFLLDNPFGGGLKGVTLVEQDTTVGDVTLEAGSFVLSKGDKNLYHYTADTVGLTTTTGSLTTLIEGADIGIDQNIVGVALVQNTTTTGGVTLNAGQLLVTLDNEDNDVDGLNTERRDVIALTITQTGINTLGSATLLFDADDVGLVANQENLDALTLVTQARFDPIIEDITDGTNTGTLVSDLINNLITDVDADPEGIAVTGVDDANGTWQYSTDGGSSWLAFGGVTDNSALLLTATANDLIRFVPDADWNGSATIDFRAWDSSDGGTSGDTGVDASTNGGDSAFSSATATGLITVRAVNDDPLNTVPGAQSIDEDTALVFSSGNGNLVAVSDDAIDGELEVTLTVSNGMLTLAQTTGLTFSAGGDGQASMTFFATVADANAALDGLSYLPDADYSGAATLTISTDDQGHVGTGGALSDSDVVNITVNAINDAPELDASEANLWLSTIDDMTGSAAPGLSNWTDGEMLEFGAPDLSFGENTTDGTFSSTGFNLDAFAGGDADIDGLHYVTQTVTVGSGVNAIDLLAGDLLLSTATAETLTSTNTLAVGHEDVFVFRPDTPGDYTAGTFIFLLDNPFGGGLKGVTLVEQDTTVGDVTLEAGSFVLSKGDKNLYHYTADTVGLTTTTGSLTTLIEGADIGIDQNIIGVALVQNTTTTGGVTLNAGQLLVTLDNEDNDVDGLNTERRDVIALTITQTGINTLGSATLLFDADDVGLVANQENLDALTLVTQARFDPIIEDITDGTNTGTLVSDLIANLISDADADPDGIAITGADETNGTWQYSIDGGSNWLVLGGVADNSARVLTATANDLLRFVPDAEWNGSASIDFRAWDGSDANTTGTAGIDASSNGGATAFSATTATGLISVRAVNDAPVLDNTGIMSMTAIDEDGIGNSGDLISDIIAGAGGDRITDVDAGAIEGIAVTGVDNTNGSWEYSTDGGTTWTAFGAVSDNNATVLTVTTNDRIRFVPNADFNGSIPTGFTFRAWDASDLFVNGSTGVDASSNGGATAFSADAETVAITVNAVNDAPVNSVPPAQTLSVDAPLVFSSGNGNLISVGDVDAAGNELEVSLSVSNGTLMLSGVTGLTFTAGGDGQASMTFTGTITDINAALDGLSYVADNNYSDADNLSITTSDQGSFGSGGVKTDTDSIAINDAPVNTLPATQSVDEDTTLTLSVPNDSALSVSAATGPVEVTLTATDGTLSLSNTIGNEFQVNTFTGGGQRNAEIVATPGGGSIVVWTSNGQDGSGEGVYAQRYDANGLPLGLEFQVNTTTLDHQKEPAIAVAGDGSFVVVWTDKVKDGSEEGIYGQRFDASGNTLGGEFRVNSYTLFKQMSADVAMDVAGNFVVVWQSEGQDGDKEGIYAQRYDNSGSKVGGEVQVNTTTAQAQKVPAVAMDDAGNFVVVWQSKDQDGSKEAIIGRRFDAAGPGFGAEFQINTFTADRQSTPAIAMNGSGQFVVAWEDKGQDGSRDGIFAQRFDATANALGSEFQVNTYTLDNQLAPAVSINASGDFVIAWQSKNQDFPDKKEGVYAQHYAADGTAIGSEFLLNTTVAGRQTAPTVALFDDGSMLAAWDDGKEVTGQRFLRSDAITFSAGDGQDDATMTFSGTQVDINAALDGLRFTPDADFAGATTLTIATNDLNNNGGGALTAVDVLTVNVNAVNDAPTLSLPAAQSTTEEVPLVFSSGNGNAITVLDIDAASRLVELSLTAVNGTMSLSGTTGLIFSAGDGSDDASMVFSGTLADINTALEGLSFSSPLDYVGLAQITVQVNDHGNTGTGGALTDAGLVYITVLSDGVNDAPLNTVPGTQYNSVDTPVVFNDANGNLIAISDDAGNLPVEVTLNATNGTLTLSTQESEEFQVNTTTANAQLNTQVATSANGAYVIVWQSGGNQDGNGDGIFAQLYDAFGEPLGGEIQINTETSGNQITPAVAMSATGSFVVAWESDGNLDGDGRGIFVQLFDPSGQPVDVEFQANTTSADDQIAPAVAMDDNGNFVVAWQSKNQDGDGEGIYAQHFDANGFALGDEFLVTTTTADHQRAPAVAMDADGDFVIVWQSTNQDGSGDGIFGQRFNALGVAQGAEFQVNVTSADHQRAPDVAMDALGNFVVSWQSGNQDGNGWGIYARHFDALGNALDAADVLVNTTISNQQLNPSVSMNAAGEHVITWQSTNQDGDGEGVYGQEFAADGTAVGSEFRLSTETADHQTAADVALTDSGHFITTWTSKNQDGNAEGVYAQQFPSAAGFNFTTGDGVDDASMVFTARLSQINAALGGMTFTPTPGFNGTASVRIQVDDLGNSGSGGALTDDDTVKLQFNTAPVLDNSGAMDFTAIDEDDVSNNGDRVSDIIASAGGNRITDADSSPLEGIAVTSVNDANGSWEYSTNGGGAWTAFGSVSSSSSVLLGASANDRIRFVPNAEYSGNVTPGITFRAWDMTDGNASGSTNVDVSVNGGNTAYSTATETADIVVNIVNDLPVATGNTVVTTENVPLVIGVSDFNFTDAEGDALISVTITGLNLNGGTLTHSAGAVNVTNGMTITAAELADLTFTSALNDSTDSSFTYTVNDAGLGVTSAVMNITVNAVDDPAAITGDISFSGNEGDAVLGDLNATDVDGLTDGTYFTVSSGATNGTALINAATGAWTFTPTDPNWFGSDNFTVTVTDDLGGTTTQVVNITLANINDAPVLGAIGDQSVNEGVELTFTATATDADLPADNLTFSLDAASIALGMSIDANSGDFSWTPTEAQGGTTPSVTVTVTDNATAALVDAETFTITVNDINVAPVLGAIGDQSVNEGVELTFTATATDADLPADNLTFSLDAASIALGMSIDANSGDFSWTPTEAQGGTTPSVTVTVTDNATAALVDAETFTITVNDINVAPVLGAIGDQSVNEGVELTFTATATDADLPADNLTFSLDAASIALGMSIDANSGDFSWTPTEAQGGTTPSVTVTVTDNATAALVDAETFTITVNDINVAPVLGAIGDQSVNEGVELTFTATATDADLPADNLTFSLDAASIALGMSIDANSGDFSWTPTEAQGGTTPSVTVTVTDNATAALVDAETFTITVNDINVAPVLGAIGDQSVNEGVELTFTATATDADLPADNLTFSLDAASIALGMSIDANSGDFSWTPTEAQGGTTPSVTVTVTDNATAALVDAETFTITVNDINVAPVLGAIGDQSVNEGVELTFTATATDADLPADNLTFSLDAASIALGMSIDANSGDFSWTPTEAQGGTTPSVTVTVTDNATAALVDAETFTITVNDINVAPVLGAIGDQSVNEGVELTFTATATDADLPADNLTFSLDAASIALGMSIDANSGDFSWTPTEAQGGTTPSVTVTVTDNATAALVDAETFTITVNDINVAPVLGAIGDQSVNEGVELTFTATATDADLPADNLTFSLDAASIALGMSIDANSGDFSWTPTEAQGGTTPSVTVTVTDNATAALVDAETFTITVNDINVAPVLGAIGDQSVNEGVELTFTATATDADLPADNLTFSLDAASIALGMSIDANSGDFSWTPTEAQGGTTPSVTVTVTDNATAALVDAETFTITVNDINVAPVLGAIGDQSVNEGVELTFTATATDADLPADNLTFSLDAASIALGMSIDANSGDFSWTPTEAQGGTTPSVTVTVTDNATAALVDAETFTITVNDINVAPVLGAIGDQSVNEGVELTFTATATDADLPADNLTFSLDAASIALGMSIDANSGDFSWTPTEAQGGTTPSVTVTVTDNATAALVDAETFTITVNDINVAPVLGAIGDQSVNEGVELTFTATATDADLPADNLTFSLDAASIALGMSIDANSGDFSWTPTEAQGGTTPSVTVTVTDNATAALVDAETFTITVNDINVAPVLGAIGDQSVNEGVELTFTATATDADLPADNLTFSLDAASIALGMSIDANSGDFSWTPTEAQGGTTPSVTVTVTDNATAALVDAETFTITVNDINVAPVLGAIGDQSVNEGVELTFTATATDADLPADNLTFSLDAASIALGMSIDANSGDFSWTPTEAQGGTTPSVTVTVTDNATAALVDAETFTITVNDINVAPVLGAIGDQSVNEGVELTFTATATDADLPADNLTFSLDAASIALGMSIDANSGDFSWTPTEAQGGTTPSVTVTVTDNATAALVDAETFTITVNDINVAPVLGAIGDQSVNEGVELTFTATATDADLPADNLTFSLDAASIALGMSIDANSGDFSWTPTEAQGGTTPSVTVTVTDNATAALVDAETFTITVNDINVAPVLGAIGDQSVNEGVELTFTATATDADLPADNLTFSLDAASIALGMSIDANSGDFSWTPTEAQGGTTPSVTVTVTDNATAALVDAETFTITVNDINVAPVLGAIGDQSVNEGVELTFTATATDADLPADNLTFSLDAASIALGMSIDANSGDFSWTPTEAQGGTTPSVTVTVTDNATAALVDAETFTITVNDINVAPVLGAIGDQSVNEGVELTFTATATDADLPADNLTFSLDAASIALGMSIDANSGDFSWTPTEAQGGTTPSVTVTVTDNATAALVDAETFTITVNDINVAPVLGAIGDQSVNEGVELTFTATATDADLPADNLTFSLDAASIALGMSIDANSGDFSWTPTEAQGGTTPSVTVTVTDNATAALVDAETFTITVNDINVAPVLGAIGDQSVNEGVELTFTATATDADLPADNLTFSLDAASIALGMSIDANSGDFSWTPTEAQGGTTPSVTVTVTDNATAALVDAETFTITVNDINVAPVLGAIGDQSVNEGVELTFTATATDADLPADNLTFSLDAASIALGMSIDANSGDFSWTPTEAQGGTTPSVTVTVTDNATAALVDAETFTITVNDINVAPVLGAIGDQSVNEGVELTFTATATDADLPADNLTFSLDAASIALGMSIDANSGDFSWTPTEAQGGTTPSVTVTVTDNATAALVDAETFTITVNDINVAPVLGAIGDQSVNEGVELTFTATATDADLPADNLTFSLDAASIALGMSIDANSGDFSWTPTEAQGGTTPSVTVTVTDNATAALVDAETFTITVNDINVAPVLGAIGDQSVNEGVELTFTATATDADLPADNLTFSLDAASIALGMSIDANSGDFSWTPTEAQGGTTPSVTVTVTDNATAALVDAETFTITVNDINVAPVLGAIGDQSVNEGVELTFTATATDADLPADNLTFSLDAASIALGMSIDANSGDFSWTPTEAQGGTTPSVTVTVTDNATAALVDAETFTITVNDINVAPVLGAIGDQSVNEGVELTFTATATDADLPADNLTFSLDAASIALGMSIDANSGDFSWTPTEAQGGTTPSVTVTVTDNATAALVDAETFTITVNGANNTPIGVPNITGTVTEDQILTADTSGISDADGLGTFAYQWQRSTDGGTTWNNAGANSVTFTLGDVDVDADIRVQVSYTDGDGTNESVTSAAVGPVLNVNDIPVGAPVITGTAQEDQTLTADTSGISDVDGLGIFSHQWLRGGVAIPSATGSTYTLGDADVGAQIAVQVIYIDGQGTPESVTSASVGPVLNVNDIPVGAPVITGTAQEDQTLTADTSGISDVDGLGIFSHQWLRDGVAIPSATGSTYTLGDADVGAQISVQVIYIDGQGTPESVTSTQTGPVANVNDAPVITSAATANAAENQTIVTTVTASDVDAGDTLSYSIIGGADAGLFSIEATTGVLTFNAAPDFEPLADSDNNGVYEVQVQVSDSVASDIQMIAVTVTDVDEFDVSVISDTDATADAVNENSVVGTPAGLTAFANDADGSNNTVTYSLTEDAGGRFAIDANTGIVTVSGPLNAETATTHTITVRADSTDGSFATRTFTIAVNDIDEAPTISANVDQVINEDSSTGALAFTVADPETAPTSLSVTASSSDQSIIPDANLVLGGSGTNRTLSVTPAPDQNGGPVTITVTVNDGISSSSESFTVTVNPVNDAAVFGGVDSGSLSEDTGVVAGDLTQSNTLTVSDPDSGESSFIAGTSFGTLGALSIDAAGNWTYAADNSQAAIQGLGVTESLTDVVTITSLDGTNHDITVTITGINDAPVANDDSYSLSQGSTLNMLAGGVLANDYDIDGDPLIATLITGPGNGILTLNADGTFSYASDANFIGNDSFTYQVSDGNGGVATNTVTLTVNNLPETFPGTDNTTDGESTNEAKRETADNATLTTTGTLSTAPEPEGELLFISTADINITVNAVESLQELTNDTTKGDIQGVHDYYRDRLYEVQNDYIDRNHVGLTQHAFQKAYETVSDLHNEILEMLSDYRLEIETRHESNMPMMQLLSKYVGVVTLSLTAGIVGWGLRGASVAATMLSSMPVWTGFDPLPVIAAARSKYRKDADSTLEDVDDEHIEEMFGGSSQAEERHVENQED